MSYTYMLKILKYKVIINLLQEIVSLIVYSQVNIVSITDKLTLLQIILISLYTFWLTDMQEKC
jgi:hypothetical protein